MERVALITGAARRIGATIARTLHGRGLKVMLHYRGSAAEAASVCDELNALRPGSADKVQGDLLDVASLPALVTATLARFSRLDVLVNNASSFFPTPVGSIGEADWDDLVGSNVKAPVFLAQAAAAELRRNQGAIVSIADIHAERPMRDHLVYNIAKAGLVAATRSLARELGPQVRVNAVAPGANIWPEAQTSIDEEARRRIVEHSILKRPGTPQDIADAVAFLALDAHYVTGHILAVDGGRSVLMVD